jgi:hypothetical protein
VGDSVAEPSRDMGTPLYFCGWLRWRAGGQTSTRVRVRVGAQETLGVRVRKREREREGRREGDQIGVKSQSTSTYAKTCWVLHARAGKLIHGSIASRWYEGDFDAPKLRIAPHEKA